jgi:hypothetical protein
MRRMLDLDDAVYAEIVERAARLRVLKKGDARFNTTRLLRAMLMFGRKIKDDEALALIEQDPRVMGRPLAGEMTQAELDEVRRRFNVALGRAPGATLLEKEWRMFKGFLNRELKAMRQSSKKK